MQMRRYMYIKNQGEGEERPLLLSVSMVDNVRGNMVGAVTETVGVVHE